MTEKAAKESGKEIKIGKFPFSASGKASAAGAKDGFVKLIFDAKYGELLGAHMIGANVTEMIAEIVAIRRAAQKLGTWRLDGCKLVVTLEPCAMCAGAIAQSRINTLVFGAWDEKAGAVGSVWDVLRDPRAIHKMEVVGGVLEAECAELLTNFFRQ
jgi:tRNA(Arg) A34 adenosine deaminase TadA